MRLPVPFVTLAPLALAACTGTIGGPELTKEGYIRELPETVRQAAAPYQDLSVVKLDQNGCYAYRYAGPVETTFLPVRTTDGRRICTRPQATPPATAE